MNQINFEVPYGIKYISEWIDYCLPRGQHVVVDKGVTGCGYTEFCLCNSDNVVLCSPRKLLLKNKSSQHEGDLNIKYIENNIKVDSKVGDKDKLKYDQVRLLIDSIKNHYYSCGGLFSPNGIKYMVTYDSLHYVIESLRELGVLNNFIFIVDEFQSIFLDSHFKAEVEMDFVEYLQECSSVIYLSATPLMKKYLERIPEFMNLDLHYLDWSKTGFVEKIKIQRRRVKVLSTECLEIIEDYLNGKYPTTINNSKIPIESKEAVFYMNSVKEILKIIKRAGLTPQNTIILCSDTPDNQMKLKKFGFKVGHVPVPSKGEKNPMFMFCTSATYMGIDLYSDNASSYVFADPNIDSLALDISLDLPQIIGRQRDRNNPFKNNITVFYKTTRKIIPREEFDWAQNKRKEETTRLLNIYERTENPEERKSFLEKMKRDSEMYVHDFVGVSSKTGKLIYNHIVDISNERAWEVSQEDYQDNIAVTKAFQDKGYDTDIYYSLNELEASEFLKEFYSTGIFEKKMKMYCEFRDKTSMNPKISEILDFKIDNKQFKKFYEYFGTTGCKTYGFKEANLERCFRDVSREYDLSERVYQTFEIGKSYSLEQIKSLLVEIHYDLGISRKAKASDLEKYFKLTRTQVTLKEGDTKVVKNGFKLGKL